MKKFTSLLIGCLLALAGAAMAQQPAEQQTPKNQKQAPEKTETAEPKTPKTRGENAAKPEATAAKPRGARNEQAPSKPQKAEATPKSEKTTGTETNVPGQPAASATPGGKHQAEQRRKGKNAAAENAKTAPSATPVTAASASAAPSVSAAGQQNARANAGIAAKKPDPQQVQQIKSQHTNFRAQPKPEQVPPVTFNQSYRIEGSDQWQGPQYEVFRSYHPERHDEGWYRSRYNRVELIGGGYYYWNNGYWYPAWGYSPSAEYYAYDGPIYVGHRAEPPDRVIADVQGELQQMGYYQGEVDGLLGPLTRQALTAYQADQGLTPTAVIDEPTLDSLGMG
jgi:Putative peptidoglycan binding domain